MIGTIDTGASFYGLLAYSLSDKRELTEEQKIAMSLIDGLQHKNRAEVLEYNLCYGDAKELSKQFRQVQRLSRRTENPVFHIMVRLAAGEVLTKNQLIDIGHACAKEFDVLDHQYITILHKDTNEQHIHLIANRVGYDGLAAKDGNSYERMAKLCRRLEKEFQLQAVLSPKKFLTPEERLLPRHDSRKEKLRVDITRTLEKVRDYPAFEAHMKALGYQVFKGRGIYFIDDKKVRIKGSEVGYSLAKIEKALAVKSLAVKASGQAALADLNKPIEKQQTTATFTKNNNGQQQKTVTEQSASTHSATLLEQLMQSETGRDYINADLYKWPKRKRKKRSRKL